MLIVAGTAITAIVASGVAAMVLILKSPKTAGQDDTPEQERVAITARCEKHLNRSPDIVKDPVQSLAFTEACQAFRLSAGEHPINREIGKEMIAQITADKGLSAGHLKHFRPDK